MLQNKYFNMILLGVIVGLLIAPDKGSKTRRKLSGAAENLSDYIQDKIMACENEVSQWENDMAENMEDA